MKGIGDVMQNENVFEEVNKRSLKLETSNFHIIHSVDVLTIDILIYPPINAINKIQFKASIRLLHVSATGCHLQRITD